MIVFTSAISADAETLTVPPTSFGTDNTLYWYITDDTKLTIGGTGAIPGYLYETRTPWYSYIDSITELTILDGVTEIGTGTFQQMTALETADLGSTVESIGHSSFKNCTNLKSVTLPQALSDLNRWAFRECSSLTEMTITNNGYFKVTNGVLTDADCTTIYWAGGITGDEYYVPSTVTTIYATAFTVPIETKIYVHNDVETIDSSAFTAEHNICGVADSAIDTFVTESLESALAESYDGMCGPTVFYKQSLVRLVTTTGKYTTTRTLTIKGVGATTNYSSVSDVPWTDNMAYIDKISISEGITSIGAYFFNGASDVSGITIPSTVTSIGAYAFADCTSITSLTLPSKLRAIGAYAFMNMPITEVNIPANVTSLNGRAFIGCDKLATITITGKASLLGLGYVAEDSVVYNKARTSLLIYPAGKSDVTVFRVPETVITIGIGCSGNASLETVYIPDNVTTINDSAFSECATLTIYGYEGTKAETFAATKGYTFISLGGTINETINWIYDEETTTLTVSGTGAIPDYTSASQTPWAAHLGSITKVVVEDGITGIGEYAFARMSKLESALLGNTITEIRRFAFYNCQNLTNVALPRDLYILSSYVFMGCEALTTVTLPDDHIGNYKITNGVLTDWDCTEIYWAGGITGDEYYVPSTVTTIYGSAFPVPLDTKIYVHDKVTTIEAWALREFHTVCGVTGSAIETYMTDQNIGSALAESYDGMCGPTVFWKVHNVGIVNPITGQITLPRKTLTLKGIGETTAYSSADLVPWKEDIATIKSINISDGVTILGANLFNGAVQVTSVALPDTITSISNDSFNGCNSLSYINLPDGVIRIGNRAFADTKLSSVSLPDSLTVLGSHTYRNTLITSIEIPASIITLGTNAFEGCASLATITVNESNKYWMAEDCVVYNKAQTSLLIYPLGKTNTYFLVPETVTTIGANCYGNANLEYIYIPKTTTTIDTDAFSACENLIVYGYTGSQAETFANDNDYIFVAVDGTAGNTANWYFDMETRTLVITGTGAISGHLPTYNAPWEDLYPLMEAIVIEEGITSIGMHAFDGAAVVEEVTIPWTMESVGICAFEDAGLITDVYYTSDEEDYENMEIHTSAGDAFINATWHFAEQKILSIRLTRGIAIVKTENIRDGKKVMIAAYTSDGIYLGMQYAEITNQSGSVTMLDADYVKAFIIDLETLKPISNAVSSE